MHAGDLELGCMWASGFFAAAAVSVMATRRTWISLIIAATSLGLFLGGAL